MRGNINGVDGCDKEGDDDNEGGLSKRDKGKERITPGKLHVKTPFGTRSSLMHHSQGLVGVEKERQLNVHHSSLSHFDDDDESDGFESD